MTFENISPYETIVTLRGNELQRYKCAFPDGMPDSIDVHLYAGGFTEVKARVPEYLKALLGRQASRKMYAVNRDKQIRTKFSH